MHRVNDATDRESILRALEDEPAELGELCGMLLQEHEWRVHEGCRVDRSRAYRELASIALVLNVRRVVEIAGIPVNDSDAWWIVDELLTIGRADDVTAAWAIEVGVTAGEPIDWLTLDQKEAIVLALTYAPARLDPLRLKLARDNGDHTSELRADPEGSEPPVL